jgi:hypothetical protein
MAMQVDDEGWAELRDLYSATLQQAYKIKQQARERLTEAGTTGTSVVAFSTFFELPLDRVIPRTFDWVPPS